jgi:F-type H+-transporting ATPase subunit b
MTTNVLKKLAPFLYGLFGVVQSSLALAQEEAGHGGEEAMTFVGDWLPRLVNFAIITAVVVYFTKKPVRDFFKNRSAEIAKAMQESKETRERAVAALSEMERKIKELEVETSRLIADAQARGEKDKRALVEEGKKAAQDIKAQAKQGINLEVMKAKAALATEAAILSLDLAEGKIKDKIDRQDQDRIVKEYISKVGGKT